MVRLTETRAQGDSVGGRGGGAFGEVSEGVSRTDLYRPGFFNERLEGSEGAWARQREQPVQRPWGGFKELRPCGVFSFYSEPGGAVGGF